MRGDESLTGRWFQELGIVEKLRMAEDKLA